ncbi:hypothetical protein IWQ61_007394 [Dispira simplex]|nr:hypothetical protein IWQ61_007394 [Dispira simplex]
MSAVVFTQAMPSKSVTYGSSVESREGEGRPIPTAPIRAADMVIPASFESEEGFESDRDEQTQQQLAKQLAAEESIDLQVIRKRGYLSKRSGKLKVWKRKWFVLRTTTLACYRDEKEYEITQLIYLRHIRTIAKVVKKGRENVFGIITTDKMYYLQADTPVEMDDWIEDIRVARHNLLEGIPPSETTGISGRPPGRGGLSRSHTVASTHRRVSSREEGPTVPLPTISLTITQPRAQRISPILTGTSAPLKPSRLDINQTHVRITVPEVEDSSAPAFSRPSPTSPHPLSPGAVDFVEAMGDISSDDEDEPITDPTIHASLSSAEVLKRSYLLKRDKYKHWGKRWFVLRPKSLSYYRNNKENGVPRIIPLDQLRGLREPSPDSHKAKKPIFCLQSNKRNYWLCADTKQLADTWKELLMTYIASTHAGSDGQTTSTVGAPLPPCPS